MYLTLYSVKEQNLVRRTVRRTPAVRRWGGFLISDLSSDDRWGFLFCSPDELTPTSQPPPSHYTSPISLQFRIAQPPNIPGIYEDDQPSLSSSERRKKNWCRTASDSVMSYRKDLTERHAPSESKFAYDLRFQDLASARIEARLRRGGRWRWKKKGLTKLPVAPSPQTPRSRAICWGTPKSFACRRPCVSC